jgi:hypothetical protein
VNWKYWKFTVYSAITYQPTKPMKSKQLIKQLSIIIVSGILIFGCKKLADHDQNSEKPDLASETSKASIESLYGSHAACGPDVSAARSSTAKKVVNFSNTVFNTDYLSVGVGGMRDVGTGTLTVTGSFALSTVTRAYLYWHGVSNSSTDVGKKIKVNTSTVEGTSIGVSASNCWPYTNSQAYRADVTSLVKSSGGRTFDLSDFGELNPNGASLILFYSDGNSDNNRDIVLFEGNDSNAGFSGFPDNPNAPADPEGWDVLLSGLTYQPGNASIELHVGDGQPFTDDAIVLNGTQIAPTGAVFNGTTVPGGALWDIRSFDVASFLSPSATSLNITTGLNADCLSLIVAVINLPAGSAPPVVKIKVPFDYRPLCCPNKLVCSSKGAEEAAVLGTSSFDVTHIDLSTVKLNGVSFTKSSLKDKSAPFNGTVSDCSTCFIGKPDGITDLELSFNDQSLLKTFGNVKDKQCVKVTLTGNLLPQFGSTPIEGVDFIVISKK